MLVLHDPFQELTYRKLFEDMVRSSCWLYATELLPVLDTDEETLFSRSIRRAMEVCAVLGIPIDRHFQPVLRIGEAGIFRDYHLTSLGGYLTIINSEPTTPLVARAQLFFLHQYDESVYPEPLV